MSQQVTVLEPPTSEMHAPAPSKPAGASVVAAVTILLSSFNILTEAVYDCLEWTDLVRYRGLGWTMLGGLFLFISIFTAMTRGRIALLVSAGIAVYYVMTIIVPAFK